MSRYAYNAWWILNTDDDGELIDLPEPVASLAAHVMALQERIGRLPAPDEVVDLFRHRWIQQCACAYDHFSDQCIPHKALTEHLREGQSAFNDLRKRS